MTRKGVRRSPNETTHAREKFQVSLIHSTIVATRCPCPYTIATQQAASAHSRGQFIGGQLEVAQSRDLPISQMSPSYGTAAVAGTVWIRPDM